MCVFVCVCVCVLLFSYIGQICIGTSKTDCVCTCRYVQIYIHTKRLNLLTTCVLYILFLQTHREIDRFLSSSGVQLAQSHFHFRRETFSSQLKVKVGHILVKATTLRIMLNVDGPPITTRSHTHPSHTQNFLLLTSSLSLGVPGPRATQCMRGA